MGTIPLLRSQYCEQTALFPQQDLIHPTRIRLIQTKTFGEVFGDISAFFSKKVKKLDNMRKSFKMQDMVASIKSKFS